MSKKRKSNVCFNCSTELLNQENFCPNCGQENHSKQATIKDLSMDLIGESLSFDSRLFRSIVPLILKPGLVTIEYLDGKRRRYIPPIRVFLFLSFLYFGLSLIFDESAFVEINFDESEEIVSSVIEGLQKNFNLLILLYIPLFAFLIRLFFKSDKRSYFVNFFVYALHLFSFFFVLGIVQILLFQLIDFIPNQEVADWTGAILQLVGITYILVYSVVSLNRVFTKKHTILRFIVVLLLSVLAFLTLLFLTLFFLLILSS